ncbi:hypothetical protein GGI06_000509 [Coemansia sp. S85]|nr:hypothetical protein GGI06_000509 [Coemansia sp. S85]
MATIPTLIIAPAILAAGITYKYTGGEGPDAGTMRRRRSEMDAIRGRMGGRVIEDVHSARVVGERFEQDFQPRVPTQQRQLANTFIPTSILISGTTLQAQAAGDPPESSSDSNQGSGSLSSRKTLYGMSGGPTELAPDQAGRYPRTTEEIEQTSWLQRAARSITGDLGPIEHQERVASLQHAREAHQSADHGEAGPRYFTRDSVNDARDRFRSMKREVDEDIDQKAAEALRSATQAFDETQGWFWSTKKSVDDAAASAVDDAKKTANDVADSAKDAADKTRDWFWSTKKGVDEAAASAVDGAKQAAEETQGWFQSKKQEADDAAQSAAQDVKRRASDMTDSARQAAKDAQEATAAAAQDVRRRASDASDSAKQAAEETRGWFWSKKQEADDAAQSAAQDIKRRASDASDSAKQAADSTWSWLWWKKKEVDDTAATALDAAKSQAQSARDSAAAKSQQAKEALGDAAETASDWVSVQKESADDAMAAAADSARQSASNARDWAESTRDDISNSIGRADDASRAWLWNAKGQVDQAVADTAGAVRQQAEAASNSAYESADAASRSYWQRGLGSGTNAGWRGPSADSAKEDSQKQRRDSLLSGIDDNAVIHTLDEKFNEARSMLRSTAGEIKTMANDAGSAASETLRTAAEKTLPRPTTDGIITKEPSDDGHRDDQAQFVEVDSHIPLLSSSPHKRT